jgi:CRP/FNR family nitrogen fixation transcriptional regulator
MQTALAVTRPSPCGPHFPAAPVDAPLLGTTRALAKGEELYAEGDPAPCFYKVLSGAVCTSMLLDDGRRQIDAFHLPGDVFGLERGHAHRSAAEAVGDATVIAYRRSALGPGAGGSAEAAQALLDAILRSLERAQGHMLLLGRKTAMERIASFLLDMAGRAGHADHIDLPMTRADIADHLGLTIETVSRLLARLEREGIIEMPAQRRTIRLRRKGHLVSLAAAA